MFLVNVHTRISNFKQCLIFLQCFQKLFAVDLEATHIIVSDFFFLKGWLLQILNENFKS